MKRKECAACGIKTNLQFHHLVPRSKGGSDDETNLVTLCTPCHGLWHNMPWSHDHRALMRDGVAKAKEEGKRFGPKPTIVGSPLLYLKKGNQPIDDVIFCLFHIDGINMTRIREMTWGEITIFLDAYSDTTEQMIKRAADLHTYSQKDHFTWPISLSMQGLIRSPNAMTQKMRRMRDGKEAGLFPFQLPDLDPPIIHVQKLAKKKIQEENHEILVENKKKIEEGEGTPEKLRKLIDLV